MRAPWVERGLRILVLLCVATASGAAPAQSTFEPRDFATSEHEQRFHALIDELRCLVCQNQNIAESNADLASDLRREVYRMVEDGRSADEISEFMVERYGDFVLYRPPVRSATLVLWIGPFVLAAIGAAVLVVHLRRRRRSPAPPLDEDTRERVRRLIDSAD